MQHIYDLPPGNRSAGLRAQAGSTCCSARQNRSRPSGSSAQRFTGERVRLLQPRSPTDKVTYALGHATCLDKVLTKSLFPLPSSARSVEIIRGTGARRSPAARCKRRTSMSDSTVTSPLAWEPKRISRCSWLGKQVSRASRYLVSTPWLAIVWDIILPLTCNRHVVAFHNSLYGTAQRVSSDSARSAPAYKRRCWTDAPAPAFG